MQAIILCGGKGTRLNALYADRPKILVPIAGRPFLEWQLEWLGSMGVTDIHLAGGYKAEELEKWLETRRQQSVTLPHITLSTEPGPLGTGGGLKFAEPWFRSDPVLVLNGDSLAPHLDLSKLILTHRDSGRPLTIAAVHIEGTGRYGTVEFDSSNGITAFREKADRTEGWINAGVYLAERKVLNNVPSGKGFSIETELFPDLVHAGLMGAFPCLPPLLDMGTPEGIIAMESFLRGKTESRP